MEMKIKFYTEGDSRNYDSDDTCILKTNLYDGVTTISGDKYEGGKNSTTYRFIDKNGYIDSATKNLFNNMRIGSRKTINANIHQK